MTTAILDEVDGLKFDTRKGARTEPGTPHTPAQRRTLSGALVQVGRPTPPTWHELVQPQPKQPAPRHEGLFYADVLDELPNPRDLIQVVVAVPPSYRDRRAQKGGYSRALRRTLGEAWTRRRAEKHAAGGK